MNLENWRKAVDEHISIVDQTIRDRDVLKKSIEEHLGRFFDWDSIDYNRDFTVITLSWEKDVNPVIKSENISDLGMDWIIKTGRDSRAFAIVEIEVYPWGIKEND